MNKIIVLSIAILGAMSSYGQGYDFFSQREFDQLARINPAYTGILERLRLLASNRGADLNIGLESKVFKSKHYIGGGFQQVSLSHIRRQKVYGTYSRDIKFKNESVMKIAIQGEYVQKSFFRSADDVQFNFSDFDGREYRYDSLSSAFYSDPKVYGDIGFGFAYLGKRVLLGANGRNLLMPAQSISSEVKQRLPIQLDAQGCATLKRHKLVVIPSGIFRLYDGNMLLQAGLGLNFKEYTLVGNFASVENQKLVSAALNYRKGRIFASAGYQFEPGLDEEGLFKLTVNASLRKPREQALEILERLGNVY